ncbi:MAG: Helix-turn-helix domain protein [Methanoregula sp. PtaU1.Bin051]|nr:MAG: Helix-turn-helix domain protein [Methanoregula sp. PtaU1.Bin051]
MADPVVVLEPGGERAQKIAKAMASQTAGDILRLIGEGQKTSTEIADQLKIPINTATYHIGNLLDAGLISVAETKYSVKGREVKVYSLTNQLLIVAPRQSNVRSLLLKYTSLFGIVAFGSVVIAALTPVVAPGSVVSEADMNWGTRMAAVRETGGIVTKVVSDNLTYSGAGANGELFAAGTQKASEIAAANITPAPPAPVPALIPQAAQDTAASVTGVPDPALMFFIGGTLVILLLLCYEMYLWKRQKYR